MYTAEEALMEFEPVVKALARRALRTYRSNRVGVEDLEQEARLVVVKAVQVFASPDAPTCPMGSWVWMNGWQACTRLMRTDAGLTQQQWREKHQLTPVFPLLDVDPADVHSGDALPSLALRAGLTPKETAVVDERMQLVNGKPTPWEKVAQRTGIPSTTCVRLWESATRKLRPLAA